MMKAAPHRILVVDDVLDERFFTERALKKVMAAGGMIHLVNSGNEAIAYMIGEGEYADRKRYPFPTLVITDLNMEDGDGFDVLEFLQNNPEWSIIPRIVYSSSNDDDDVRTAFFLGVSAYHVKPPTQSETDKLLRGLVEYWATSAVPPVDENGRLLITESIGRRGARYPQLRGGAAMKRPLARELAKR
jgi:CheY-like chemotaxis protein